MSMDGTSSGRGKKKRKREEVKNNHLLRAIMSQTIVIYVDCHLPLITILW